MTLYLTAAYLHLVFGIVLIGYALFWLVMAYALRSRAADLDTGEMLAVIGRAGWPPFVAPPALRIPILGIGWLLVLAMLASGFALLGVHRITLGQLLGGGFGQGGVAGIALIKLTLLGLYAAVHAWFSLRPSPRLALVALLLVTAALCASAFLR